MTTLETRLAEIRDRHAAKNAPIPPHDDCYFDEPCSQQAAHVARSVAHTTFMQNIDADTAFLLAAVEEMREALQLIQMRREGFNEDLEECPKIASLCLARVDRLAPGHKS